ncbi:phosphoglycerate mutase-like protein [Conidiobolus coronatus NRRL 28638]|uniref:Phosphoglycerate mutase-like protein n=1 Tax=Conidiobolus coronatus (strain ATCC 28846 / CBS 209.66 / NRRL 28638) TaxID=796925 RepID=A0A137P053_CONC2|nr:phosphoglycerate mutase-like protein [Conidiobolus coronatus NRRL 28638]|eukprot:KXN68239.1 phosphoglycerate mutase-like protein [Conidiobolus coronatus NRRL 28638]
MIKFIVFSLLLILAFLLTVFHLLRPQYAFKDELELNIHTSVGNKNKLEKRLKKLWKSLPKEDNLVNYSYCEAESPSRADYKNLRGEGYELSSIYLMTRHGARTPGHFLPPGLENDRWYCPSDEEEITMRDFPSAKLVKKYGIECNPSKEPCYAQPYKNKGQLTGKGMRQLADLGHNLFHIYSEDLNFIPKDWEQAKDIIQVRSTDFWRTFQSAQSLMTGYFSASMNQKSSPLIINSVTKELESILISEPNCPTIRQRNAKLFSTKEYKKFLKKVDPIREAFSQVLDTPFLEDNPLFLEKIVDIFQSRECHQKAQICFKDFFNCVKPEWNELAMAYANQELRILLRDSLKEFPNYGLIRSGGFLMEVKRNILFQVANSLNDFSFIDIEHEHFKDQLESLKRIKWYYYSGHDTSIGPVLGALGAEDMRWPPFRSNFIIELWKPNIYTNSNPNFKDFKVNFIYNGSPLKMKWCSSGYCNLDDFLNYLDNNLNLIIGWERYLKDLNKKKLFDLDELCWSSKIVN